jgi:hypothetical protein
MRKEGLRVKYQMDTAAGNGKAIGHGNYDRLKVMMLKYINIDLMRQPERRAYITSVRLRLSNPPISMSIR